MGCTEVEASRCYTAKILSKKEKQCIAFKTGNYESKARIWKHQNDLPNAYSMKTSFLLVLCYNWRVPKVTHGRLTGPTES